jgi:hypothetical protein
MEKVDFKRVYTIQEKPTQKEKVFCDEIYETMKNQPDFSYGVVRGKMNKFGARYVYDIFLQLKKEGYVDWRLFLWKIHHDTKVVYEDQK